MCPASNPIDWNVARQLTGGDETLLADLVAMFPQQSQKQLDEMRSGIAAADGARLERGAHSLKSSARLFGANDLAAVALELEHSGRDADFTHAQTRLDALERELDRVVTAVQNR